MYHLEVTAIYSNNYRYYRDICRKEKRYFIPN